MLLRDYIIAGGGESPSLEELDAVLARYPFFDIARIIREKLTGAADARLAVAAPWRAESSLCRRAVDADAVRRLTADDIIDRFLREDDLRIVATEEEPEEEVVLQADLDADDEAVSEDLAKIYLSQGLFERAIAIYRKLSLQNPEKSSYFAELISKIENKD